MACIFISLGSNQISTSALQKALEKYTGIKLKSVKDTTNFRGDISIFQEKKIFWEDTTCQLRMSIFTWVDHSHTELGFYPLDLLLHH